MSDFHDPPLSKLIDMDDWKEIGGHVLEKEASTLDSLAWADDGKILR